MAATTAAATTAAIALSVTVGTLAGLGGYTFVYAKGSSYLSNDPAACANCHVMSEYLDGWVKSSHHAVATCNDCHLGHDFLGKWTTKASNGFWHSLAFTTGDFPDPLLIKPGNREVAEAACRGCHQAIVQQMHAGDGDVSCIRCHGAVGHPRLVPGAPAPARR